MYTLYIPFHDRSKDQDFSNLSGSTSKRVLALNIFQKSEALKKSEYY